MVVRQEDHPAGYRVPPHQHGWAQLLYAWEGVMRVITEAGQWVVPCQRAVWIPPRIEHEVYSIQRTRLRNLYICPGDSQRLPDRCSVVQVSPLLRELIREVAGFPVLYDEAGPEGRLVSVLMDQICQLPVNPLHLPIPADSRLLQITRGLLADPADERSLQAWSEYAGASARTLARLFRVETGMTFGQWRQQVRLLEALGRIAGGDSIARVAGDLGYQSQSAFIAMFRRALGTTPGQYFADPGETREFTEEG